MGRQPSQIIVYTRAENYYADVKGCFGGGYSGALAGRTPAAAAIFALREKGRYIDTNPLGGRVIAPREVQAEIDRLSQ